MSQELTETTLQLDNPFSEESWSETPPQVTVEAVTPAVITEEAKTEGAVTTEAVAPDVETFLEKEFGKKSTELKAEYEELKALRETAATKEEIKFANEQMQNLFGYLQEGKTDDVYSFLDTQRKLAAADSLGAADAIRLNLKMSNPHFSDLDVQDVFEEKYGLSQKPAQAFDETDEDFDARTAQWQAQADKVSRRLERDAVGARGDLARLKTEIVLPHIGKGADPKTTEEAASKEAERIRVIRDQYLQALEANYKNVRGYETAFKDKEVEIPVSYQITDEEKTAYKSRLENFDVDGFITGRWFNPDGSPNVNQLMEDIYLLDNKSKVFQKLVNEAGEKRFAHYLKTQGAVRVDGRPEGTFNPGTEKAEAQKAAEFFFSN